MTERFSTRAQAFEESENVGRNESPNATFGDIVAARFGRRDLLQGALGVAAIAATVGPLALASAARAQTRNGTPSFSFKEVTAGAREWI